MADNENFELDLDNLDEQINNKNKIQERIVDLSHKVKTAAEERDLAAKKAEEAEQARLATEKERDFYKDFSQVAGKYQGASEFQEDILTKVKGGYTVEDATVAVLNARGKLIPEAKPQEREQVAGGSSPTSMTMTGEKPLADMTQAEKRAALVAAGFDQPR